MERSFTEEFIDSFGRKKTEEIFELLFELLREQYNRLSRKYDITVCFDNRKERRKVEYFFGSGGIYYMMKGFSRKYRLYNAFRRKKKIAHDHIVYINNIIPDLPEENIVGKAWFRYWPADRIGIIRGIEY